MLRDFAIDATGYWLETPVLNHSSLPVVTGLETMFAILSAIMVYVCITACSIYRAFFF